jgi:hypothetical protein
LIEFIQAAVISCASQVFSLLLFNFHKTIDGSNLGFAYFHFQL